MHGAHARRWCDSGHTLRLMRWRIRLLVLAAMAVAVGCGSSTDAARTAKAEPAKAAACAPKPLLLAFHGLRQSAVYMKGMTDFDALGKREGFIAAFPIARHD